MNDFDDYHDYWKILHSNEHNNTEVRFLNLINVLNNLKTNTSCDCGQSASDFLIDMLNLDNEDVNYYIVKQKFLSLKNLKLDWTVYKIYEFTQVKFFITELSNTKFVAKIIPIFRNK